MPDSRFALRVLWLGASVCLACSRQQPAPEGPAGADRAESTSATRSCADRDPQRHVFFGDLHVHTARSMDAYIFQTRATPDDAYRFARGEPIRLPPLDAQGQGTREVRLARPLDFTAVTD